MSVASPSSSSVRVPALQHIGECGVDEGSALNSVCRVSLVDDGEGTRQSLTVVSPSSSLLTTGCGFWVLDAKES